MAFTLLDLPFDRQALEPHMSGETLDFHHGKHHKAYVDKVNAMADEKGLAGASLSEVIKAAAERGDKACSTIAARSGTIISSGNAWRPPRASSPPAALRL